MRVSINYTRYKIYYNNKVIYLKFYLKLFVVVVYVDFNKMDTNIKVHHYTTQRNKKRGGV